MPNATSALYPEKISFLLNFFQLSNANFSFVKPMAESVVKAI